MTLLLSFPSIHLFSFTSYRECSGPDERSLICERQVVLGLAIAVCTRCARTRPEIRYESLPKRLALRFYHDRRTPITRICVKPLALNWWFLGPVLFSCLPQY